MKKQLFVALALTALLSQQSYAAEMAVGDVEEFFPPAAVEIKVGRPMFVANHIQMATSGLLCGGLTLIPQGDYDVRVRSQRFAKSLFGSAYKPGKVLSNWVDIGPGGQRFAYDWAGLRASYHYRVFCQVRNPRGNWMPVDCYKVISLYDVQHNRACLIGPAGPSASYSGLNMNTKNR